MKKKRALSPAVFLDRDGVVIAEVNYLRSTRQLRVLPGAARAIARLRRAGYRVVMVTNQSGVARGYLTLRALKTIHAELRRRLRGRNARLDAIYFCPHLPEITGPCRCRKPGTGMLERARKAFRLDMGRSVMVGDTTVDLKTARSAGCGAVLVRTGKAGRDGRCRIKADKTFRDLAGAAAWILRGRR